MAGTALLFGTGCVYHEDRPRAGTVYVEPAPVQTVFIEDDYVYYPRYRMYYGSRSHSYYYQDGPSWVARPAPRGVSVNVLFSSPSVVVDFHDRPALHHSQVIQTYPKNWKPAPGNHGHKEIQQDNHREDNNKR